MAEELIIRIDTTGSGGRRGPQAGQQQPGSAAIAGAGIASGALRAGSGSTQRRRMKDLAIGDLGTTRSGNERLTKSQLRELEGVNFSATKGRLETPFTRRYTENETGIPYGVETALGYGVRRTGEMVRQAGNWAQNNPRKVMAGAGALAYKVGTSYIDYASYTSGNTARNQQTSNTMKLGGYGAAIAMTGGTASLFVAGGIIANEAISGFVDYQKYRFDRRMESHTIENAKTVAGDISYGRRRGGR